MRNVIKLFSRKKRQQLYLNRPKERKIQAFYIMHTLQDTRFNITQYKRIVGNAVRIQNHRKRQQIHKKQIADTCTNTLQSCAMKKNKKKTKRNPNSKTIIPSTVIY